MRGADKVQECDSCVDTNAPVGERRGRARRAEESSSALLLELRGKAPGGASRLAVCKTYRLKGDGYIGVDSSVDLFRIVCFALLVSA